jgi:hypothetical protein
MPASGLLAPASISGLSALVPSGSLRAPRRSMSDGSNYLDPDRPEAVRLSVGNAWALGEAALVRIGYGADDACIITDQMIDNALCGYRFAGCPHPRGRATRRPGTPTSQSPSYTNHPSPPSSEHEE